MKMPRRILLVDDEPGIRKMVGKRLQVAGFQVTVSPDGEDAMLRVRKDPPDLVILDIMLPGVDGFTVCETLKQDARTRHVPIILFSAKDSQQDYRRGMAAGADAYITKPYKPQDLEGLVVRMVEALSRTKPSQEGGNASV